MENIKVLKLSDCKNKEYVRSLSMSNRNDELNIIVPSNDPRCIYKAIGLDPNEHKFYISYNHYNGTPITIRILYTEEHGRKSCERAGEEFIYNMFRNVQSVNNYELLVDLNGEFKYVSANDRYNNDYIKYDVFTIETNSNYSDYFDYEINHDERSFYLKIGNIKEKYKPKNDSNGYDYGLLKHPLKQIHDLKYIFKSNDDLNTFLEYHCNVSNKTYTKIEHSGVTKTIKALGKIGVAIDSPLKSFAFALILNTTKSTSENMKGSVVFNKIFENVTSSEDFEKVISKLYSHIPNIYYYSDVHKNVIDILVRLFPELLEIKKEIIKKKSTGAFNKIMADLDFVNIDADKYPLIHAAVFNGDIPLGAFFRKSDDSYFMYNDNWALWEEMLTLHRDVAIEIASEASKRTTYEKDIMSYFYFVLHELPNYLEAHTGKKWTVLPKMLNSSDDLDIETPGSNGVIKKRSAMTPIVDNDNCTVTVPYVTMRVSGGYGDSYCYGLSFSVLKKGFAYKGNVVTNEVETALNGRDDYGLMFYTLTGSNEATGYPTFLIIFEHLENSTKVHFHRVNPMRSKNKEYNPVHNWITGCYKWMVGNVNFERILAQQGDLAFVTVDNIDNMKGDWETVNSYDSHCFDQPVQFLMYNKDDKNIIGYVKLENDTVLNHHEHMNRLIPKGTYEIRQCRSFEANPKGIWSLRID